MSLPLLDTKKTEISGGITTVLLLTAGEGKMVFFSVILCEIPLIFLCIKTLLWSVCGVNAFHKVLVTYVKLMVKLGWLCFVCSLQVSQIYIFVFEYINHALLSVGHRE